MLKFIQPDIHNRDIQKTTKENGIGFPVSRFKRLLFPISISFGINSFGILKAIKHTKIMNIIAKSA